MKKFLIGMAGAALVAATAFSFSGCSKPQKVKLLDTVLTSESYGYCVNDSDTELKNSVNELITALCGASAYDPVTANEGAGVTYDIDGDSTNETVTFKTIYEAVNNGTAKSITALTSLPSGANASEYLVVATETGFEPFEYMKGNKFAGIDMIIADMLAQKLGKNLVIKDMEFDSVALDVSNGDSDIGMAGMTISEGRAEHVTFSNAYYLAAQRIAVLESEMAFDGCTTEAQVRAVIEGMGKVTAGAAAAQTGYYYLTGSTDFDFAGYENVTAKEYQTIGLAVKDLSNGKVKFVVGDGDVIAAAVKSVNAGI